MKHAYVSYRAFLAGAIACAGFASGAEAADTLSLTLKDHGFSPVELHAPAGQRFRIEITNKDDTPAEFESSDLRAEKIVVPGGTISVMAGPLKPGSYEFFDDYHPDVAKGRIVVTEQQAEK